MEEFRDLGGEGKEEDADFFKAWLCSQHAETIREGKKGAKPQDYDRIGTEFHRWVRDHHDDLGLEKSADSVAYIDIMLARRLWNYRSMAQSTMRYSMFQLMKDTRRKAPDDLAEILTKRLEQETETFAINDVYRLNQMNRWSIHHLLARMIEHIELESGMTARYPEYCVTSGKLAYEVEHIWANKPERFIAEFPQPTDFAEYRNRIGALLLLPKSFNASYGALEYERKLPHYLGQNLLAKSLHPDCYTHNPGFLRFLDASGLPFEPVVDFDKSALEKRQRLYQLLAERVWNPSRLAAILEESDA